MSRLVQGPITGEMRLVFLVQDICTFAFHILVISNQTGRARWFTATLSVHCLEETTCILFVQCPCAETKRHPEYHRLFIFCFSYFILILPDTITDPLLEGKVCCPVQVQDHPKILPWQRREEHSLEWLPPAHFETVIFTVLSFWYIYSLGDFCLGTYLVFSLWVSF